MLAYVNGALVPEEQAAVSIFDRGFLFGDGVYEVVRFFDGYGVALDAHAERLARSCALTGIGGLDARELERISHALLEANGLVNASVYLQVTRGSSGARAHMPAPGMRPTVVGVVAAAAGLAEFTQPDCVGAIVRPDPRWQRCEIKTTSLAGNILSLMEAQRAGVDECILTRDGLVGEGAYTNIAIVQSGRLATCALDDARTPVLHGTMRAWALDAARSAGLPVEERAVHERELRAADEVLMLSSRRLVSAVVRVDGAPIGVGQRGVDAAAAGPVCRALFTGMRGRIAEAVVRLEAQRARV